VEVAEVAQLDPRALLYLFGEAHGEGEEDVGGLLHRFDDGEPLHARRAHHEVGDAVGEHAVGARVVAPEEGEPVGAAAEPVESELLEVFDVEAPVVVVLAAVGVDLLLIFVRRGLRAEEVFVEVREAHDPVGHAGVEGQPLLGLQALVAEEREKGQTRKLPLLLHD
jgi:hypothetical protein